jgi:hypothetical protein
MKHLRLQCNTVSHTFPCPTMYERACMCLCAHMCVCVYVFRLGTCCTRVSLSSAGAKTSSYSPAHKSLGPLSLSFKWRRKSRHALDGGPLPSPITARAKRPERQSKEASQLLLIRAPAPATPKPCGIDFAKPSACETFFPRGFRKTCVMPPLAPKREAARASTKKSVGASTRKLQHLTQAIPNLS